MPGEYRKEISSILSGKRTLYDYRHLKPLKNPGFTKPLLQAFIEKMERRSVKADNITERDFVEHGLQSLKSAVDDKNQRLNSYKRALRWAGAEVKLKAAAAGIPPAVVKMAVQGMQRHSTDTYSAAIRKTAEEVKFRRNSLSEKTLHALFNPNYARFNSFKNVKFKNTTLHKAILRMRESFGVRKPRITRVEKSYFGIEPSPKLQEFAEFFPQEIKLTARNETGSLLREWALSKRKFTRDDFKRSVIRNILWQATKEHKDTKPLFEKYKSAQEEFEKHLAGDEDLLAAYEAYEFEPSKKNLEYYNKVILSNLEAAEARQKLQAFRRRYQDNASEFRKSVRVLLEANHSKVNTAIEGLLSHLQITEIDGVEYYSPQLAPKPRTFMDTQIHTKPPAGTTVRKPAAPRVPRPKRTRGGRKPLPTTTPEQLAAQRDLKDRIDTEKTMVSHASSIFPTGSEEKKWLVGVRNEYSTMRLLSPDIRERVVELDEQAEKMIEEETREDVAKLKKIFSEYKEVEETILKKLDKVKAVKLRSSRFVYRKRYFNWVDTLIAGTRPPQILDTVTEDVVRGIHKDQSLDALKEYARTAHPGSKTAEVIKARLTSITDIERVYNIIHRDKRLESLRTDHRTSYIIKKALGIPERDYISELHQHTKSGESKLFLFSSYARRPRTDETKRWVEAIGNVVLDHEVSGPEEQAAIRTSKEITKSGNIAHALEDFRLEVNLPADEFIAASRILPPSMKQYLEGRLDKKVSIGVKALQRKRTLNHELKKLETADPIPESKVEQLLAEIESLKEQAKIAEDAEKIVSTIVRNVYAYTKKKTGTIPRPVHKQQTTSAPTISDKQKEKMFALENLDKLFEPKSDEYTVMRLMLQKNSIGVQYLKEILTDQKIDSKVITNLLDRDLIQISKDKITVRAYTTAQAVRNLAVLEPGVDPRTLKTKTAKATFVQHYLDSLCTPRSMEHKIMTRVLAAGQLYRNSDAKRAFGRSYLDAAEELEKRDLVIVHRHVIVPDFDGLLKRLEELKKVDQNALQKDLQPLLDQVSAMPSAFTRDHFMGQAMEVAKRYGVVISDELSGLVPKFGELEKSLMTTEDKEDFEAGHQKQPTKMWLNRKQRKERSEKIESQKRRVNRLMEMLPKKGQTWGELNKFSKVVKRDRLLHTASQTKLNIIEGNVDFLKKRDEDSLEKQIEKMKQKEEEEKNKAAVKQKKIDEHRALIKEVQRLLPGEEEVRSMLDNYSDRLDDGDVLYLAWLNQLIAIKANPKAWLKKRKENLDNMANAAKYREERRLKRSQETDRRRKQREEKARQELLSKQTADVEAVMKFVPSMSDVWTELNRHLSTLKSGQTLSGPQSMYVGGLLAKYDPERVRKREAQIQKRREEREKRKEETARRRKSKAAEVNQELLEKQKANVEKAMSLVPKDNPVWAELDGYLSTLKSGQTMLGPKSMRVLKIMAKPNLALEEEKELQERADKLVEQKALINEVKALVFVDHEVQEKFYEYLSRVESGKLLIGGQLRVLNNIKKDPKAWLEHKKAKSKFARPLSQEAKQKKREDFKDSVKELLEKPLSGKDRQLIQDYSQILESGGRLFGRQIQKINTLKELAELDAQIKKTGKEMRAKQEEWIRRVMQDVPKNSNDYKLLNSYLQIVRGGGELRADDLEKISRIMKKK